MDAIGVDLASIDEGDTLLAIQIELDMKHRLVCMHLQINDDVAVRFAGSIDHFAMIARELRRGGKVVLKKEATDGNRQIILEGQVTLAIAEQIENIIAGDGLTNAPVGGSA